MIAKCSLTDFILTIQILTFLRTDVEHHKRKVMAIRPEAISSLRPSTYSFMLKILCSSDVGLKSVRKDFGVCGSGTTRVSIINHSIRLECPEICRYRGQQGLNKKGVRCSSFQTSPSYS